EDAVKTSSQSVEEIELQVPSDAESDGPGRGWCRGRLITASSWPPTARRSLRSGTTRARGGSLLFGRGRFRIRRRSLEGSSFHRPAAVSGCGVGRWGLLGWAGPRLLPLPDGEDARPHERSTRPGPRRGSAPHGLRWWR